MKFKLTSLLICLIIPIIISCNDEDDSIVNKAPQCDSSNTTFNQLYNNLVAISPNQDITTMDLETHSYTFEVLTNKTICSIGYQSLPTFNTTPYVMEIYDNTTSTVLYSGSHTFSSTATSYVSITPIQVVVGHSYTVKRIQTNWGSDISNTIGRLVEDSTGANLIFPATLGNLKITGSSFYSSGDPTDNWAIPYIDIVFQN